MLQFPSVTWLLGQQAALRGEPLLAVHSDEFRAGWLSGRSAVVARLLLAQLNGRGSR